MSQRSDTEHEFETRFNNKRKSIRLLVEWAIFGAVSIVYSFLATFSAQGGHGALFDSIVQVLSIAVGVFFFFLVYYTAVLLSDLRYEAWSDFRLHCLITLEILPDVVGTEQQRVLNKIKEIYPQVGHLPAKGVRFDTRASALSKGRWDLIVDLNAMEKLDTPRLVLVRVMGSGEVGVTELRQIGSELLRLRVLKPLTDVEAVFIVSRTGFSPGVVDSIGRGQVRGLPRLGTRLVKITDKGFRLES